MTRLLLVMLLAPWLCFSQGQGNHWKIANSSLDFGSLSVTVDTSLIDLIDDELEALTSISDSAGLLLFFSDGRRLWDWNDELITNTLAGHQSTTQGALIVPFPGRTDEYILFTLDALQNDLANGLQYTIVEACRENGVTLGQINVPLFNNLTEKMVAVRHANGVDYWLVTHEFNSNSYVVFVITESGVEFSGSYQIGVTHGPNLSSVVGQMKASPNGQYIASNITNSQFLTEIIMFNNVLGVLYNPVSFVSDTFQGFPVGAYGLSFSPDSEFLYLASSYDKRIFQFSTMSLPNESAFLLTRELVYSFEDGNQTPSFQSLQLAVDGKIYMSNLTDYLAAIEDPNTPGQDCSVQDSVIQLLGDNVFGLPAFIDSYDYTISGICDTSVGLKDTEEEEAVRVYPNPFSTQTQLNYHTLQGTRPVLQLTDMLGRTVQTLQLPSHEGTYTLDATELGTGVYFCTLLNGTEALATQKLSVVRE